MRIFAAALLFSVTLLGGGAASAKVWSFKDEGFAPYIRGDYQFSSLGATPYSQSSGMDNAFDQSYKTLTNYEFGFLYSFEQISLRFGFAVIKPPKMSGVKGSTAAGTELFTVDNDISGYVPKVGVDFILKAWPQSRVFMGAEAGLANVTVQNSYGFTAAGTAAYPGLSNFREEAKGSGTQLEYYIGGEFIAFDTTSLVVLGGFRYLKIDGLSHNLDVTNFQGSATKGGEATTNEGGKRSLDLSGSFVSVAFRFWLF